MRDMHGEDVRRRIRGGSMARERRQEALRSEAEQ